MYCIEPDRKKHKKKEKTIRPKTDEEARELLPYGALVVLKKHAEVDVWHGEDNISMWKEEGSWESMSKEDKEMSKIIKANNGFLPSKYARQLLWIVDESIEALLNLNTTHFLDKDQKTLKLPSG